MFSSVLLMCLQDYMIQGFRQHCCFYSLFITHDIHISELAFCCLLNIMSFLKVCSQLYYKDLKYVQKCLFVEALFSVDILLFEETSKT